MPLIKQLKRYRKISRKEHFLRQLVTVYSSPWIKTRASLRDSTGNRRTQYALASQQKLQADREAIFNSIAQVLGTTDPATIHSHYSAEAEDCLLAMKLVASATPSSTADTSTTTAVEPKANIRRHLLQSMLDQLLDPASLPWFYDYDFIDEIVALVRSRYLGENGTPLPNGPDDFLQALWVLSGRSLPLDEQALPQALRSILGEAHPYKPDRKPLSPAVREVIPEMADEFEAMRGTDNPARYAEICGEFFTRFNARADLSYEQRDLSLIYGYENNHHLLLRTIIGLLQEGRLTPEDPVLVLGPRYPDEVWFFRKYLGLKNTIGLDVLQAEDKVIIRGDMHAIPFADASFKLVYGANVFEYAHDMRQVVKEMVRVLKPGGFIGGICRTSPAMLPSPTGRSNLVSTEVILGLFHEHANRILAEDPGITSDHDAIGYFPSFLIELLEG